MHLTASSSTNLKPLQIISLVIDSICFIIIKLNKKGESGFLTYYYTLFPLAVCPRDQISTDRRYGTSSKPATVANI